MGSVESAYAYRQAGLRADGAFNACQNKSDAPDKSVVNRELDALDAAVDVLGNATLKLLGRLDPVTGNHPRQGDNGVAGADNPGMCHVAARINDARRKISELAVSIGSRTDELEI